MMRAQAATMTRSAACQMEVMATAVTTPRLTTRARARARRRISMESTAMSTSATTRKGNRSPTAASGSAFEMGARLARRRRHPGTRTRTTTVRPRHAALAPTALATPPSPRPPSSRRPRHTALAPTTLARPPSHPLPSPSPLPELWHCCVLTVPEDHDQLRAVRKSPRRRHKNALESGFDLNFSLNASSGRGNHPDVNPEVPWEGTLEAGHRVEDPLPEVSRRSMRMATARPIRPIDAGYMYFPP